LVSVITCQYYKPDFGAGYQFGEGDGLGVWTAAELERTIDRDISIETTGGARTLRPMFNRGAADARYANDFSFNRRRDPLYARPRPPGPRDYHHRVHLPIARARERRGDQPGCHHGSRRTGSRAPPGGDDDPHDGDSDPPGPVSTPPARRATSGVAL
jgi:hypothetical protein